jgi:hypothetical protein
MQVYFARSIRGNRSNSDNQVNMAIVQAIKAAGHIPALELEKPTGVYQDLAHYIYQRDIEWLDGSKAMIAEVSNPSLGVGYEIAYARHVVKIPIMFVANGARRDNKVSAMIAGSGDVFYYMYLHDLQKKVMDFLKESERVTA